MSIQAMGRVWDLDLPHAERLVLLALADHADHVGDNIYPSIGLIAWKTGYSSRQVQRIIKSLVAMAILVTVEEQDGLTTVYRMDLTAGSIKQPYRRQNVRGDKTSGVTKRPPKPRQNVTPTPDIAMSPKPPVKPSVNPQGERATPPLPPTLEDDPAVVIYEELFERALTPDQRTLVAAKCTDGALWRRACEEWRLNGYSAANLAGLIDRYQKQATLPQSTPRANKPRPPVPRPSEQPDLHWAEDAAGKYLALPDGSRYEVPSYDTPRVSR